MNGLSPTLTAVSFSDLRGWEEDDHDAAFAAFLVSAKRMVDVPYKTRALGVSGEDLIAIAQKALNCVEDHTFSARDFFEENFQPHKVAAEGEREVGFLTGFFEPVVSASREKSDTFPIPLLRQPPELIEIDETEGHPALPDGYRFARQTEIGHEVFFDRGEIQEGVLDNRGLELVWLRGLVDAFFVHVQGSARMRFSNGDEMRATYAAKSGHPYTSLGKHLCERLGVPQSQMTSDRLKQWMVDHPDELRDLLAKNRSYIFFKEVLGLQPEDGPIAAAKTPLIAGRSLAVDRKLHTFGSPVWISTHLALPKADAPCRRLMIAHDTGTAIVGPARGDFYGGSGDAAGDIAGKIQHDTDFFVFVPTP